MARVGKDMGVITVELTLQERDELSRYVQKRGSNTSALVRRLIREAMDGVKREKDEEQWLSGAKWGAEKMELKAFMYGDPAVARLMAGWKKLILEEAERAASASSSTARSNTSSST